VYRLGHYMFDAWYSLENLISGTFGVDCLR